MKVSYFVDSRELILPVGFERELSEIIKISHENNFMVKVTVENVQAMRTKGMNDKFHAMCRELAIEAGDGKESTVDFIKEMAKTIATEHFGYPQLVDEDGRLQYDRDGRPKGISSADATIKQFTMLIDSLRLLADEFNYEWRED